MSAVKRLLTVLVLGTGLGAAVASVAVQIVLTGGLDAGDVSWHLAFVGFLFVGSIIVRRHPGNRVGWAFILTGWADLIAWAIGSYAFLAVERGLPLAAFATWLQAWVWAPSVAGLATAVFLFPDGRFLSHRWQWAWAAAVVGCVIDITVAPALLWHFRGPQLLDDTESAELGFGTTLAFAGFLLMLAGVLVAVISVAVRYRRAEAVQRAQLKWVLFALVLAISGGLAEVFVFGPFGVLTGIALEDSTAAEVVTSVALLTVPVAAGMAILRYRLFDIDVVISKTLVFGGLAGFITLAYVGVVVGIGTLLGRGDEPNLALSIVATALVAVAFQPVRERLTRLANRLVYGRRATPYQVLSDFSAHLGTQPASETTLAEMARLLALGTGAAATAVWLDLDGRLVPGATWPTDARADEPRGDAVVDVTHEGARLGVLTLTKKRGEQLTPVEQALVDDLAAQAGLVLRNLRLNAELRQRLVDLKESRRRLVAAQDTERRRLERDLHDGAQQQLVGLKIKLGMAKRLAEQEGATRTAALVDQLSAEADDAVATLRALAHGIYPPLLASDGLPAALEAAARRVPIPVTVSAEGVGRYPPDVEAAVYYCVLEALQNTTKYANATSASVTLAADDGQLTFEVRDDGAGFDPTTVRPGAGTTNMTDRLDALDGTLAITSTPGAGTTVTATVPVPEPAATSA